MSTTGLIAGADSRKAIAGPIATPRESRAAATGTDPHSQPGSAQPAMPAIGTARAARSGSARVKNDGGTNTAMAVEISTPSARNGEAWMQIAAKTVVQADTDGVESRPLKANLATTATSSSAQNTSVEPIRRRSGASDAGVTRAILAASTEAGAANANAVGTHSCGRVRG